MKEIFNLIYIIAIHIVCLPILYVFIYFTFTNTLRLFLISDIRLKPILSKPFGIVGICLVEYFLILADIPDEITNLFMFLNVILATNILFYKIILSARKKNGRPFLIAHLGTAVVLLQTLIAFTVSAYLDKTSPNEYYDGKPTIDIIKQDIGGYLRVEKVSDIYDSWNIKTKYMYITLSNDTLKLGEGYFYQIWQPPINQIYKYKNWYLFPSSERKESKLIMWNLETEAIKNWILSEDDIIDTEIWQDNKPDSYENNTDKSCNFISKIKDNIVFIRYEYKSLDSEIEEDSRILKYKIDQQTGDLTLIDVIEE